MSKNLPKFVSKKLIFPETDNENPTLRYRISFEKLENSFLFSLSFADILLDISRFWVSVCSDALRMMLDRKLDPQFIEEFKEFSLSYAQKYTAEDEKHRILRMYRPPKKFEAKVEVNNHVAEYLLNRYQS